MKNIVWLAIRRSALLFNGKFVIVSRVDALKYLFMNKVYWNLLILLIVIILN
jgi:hypothetical protein